LPSTVAPSRKVTMPVGVPAPGATAVTVAVKVTDWPGAAGLTDGVTATAVTARLTVTPTTAEVLAGEVPLPRIALTAAGPPSRPGVPIGRGLAVGVGRRNGQQRMAVVEVDDAVRPHAPRQSGHCGRERHGLPDDGGCGRRAKRRRRLGRRLRQVQLADRVAAG